MDQLYSGVESTGAMTPAPQSGMNTPFYAQSRVGSHENLAGLSGLTSIENNSHHQPHTGAVTPAALSSRLQNLNIGSRSTSFLRRHTGTRSGATTPHTQHYHHNNDDDGYFGSHGHSASMSGHHSRDPHSSNHSAGHRSNPLSRRNSHDDNGASRLTSGHQTPEHLDFTDLTKVPSYQTAVKTPVRGMSYSENLPNYETVLASPPSPNRRFSSMASRSMTAPGPAPATSVENIPRTTHNDATNPATTTAISRNPWSSMGFTPIHPPAPAVTTANDSDERRRLSVLQNRDSH